MWRNIIVMSLYQLIVCLVLLFAGEDLLDLRGTGDHHYIVLRLNSVIFNSFVFMQIFSEINSRKIAELNIFENIQKSPIFVGIIIVTIATQVAFIEGVGRSVVGPAIGFMNLTGAEWAVSVIIGFFALPVGLAARLMPLHIFPGMTDDEADEGGARISERLRRRQRRLRLRCPLAKSASRFSMHPTLGKGPHFLLHLRRAHVSHHADYRGVAQVCSRCQPLHRARRR